MSLVGLLAGGGACAHRQAFRRWLVALGDWWLTCHLGASPESRVSWSWEGIPSQG